MRIEIVPAALADFLLAIRLCPVEISGLGKVQKLGEGNFLIEEIMVFKQSCSLSKTDFDSGAHGFFLHTLMKEGRGEAINDLRLWWHSHVYSKTRWSSKDCRNIERFNGCEYMISLVGNKHIDYRLRLDYFQPERKIFDDLDLHCVSLKAAKKLMLERESAMKAIIADRVKIVEDKDED